MKHGKEMEAEAAFKLSAVTIESIAAALATDTLIRSFLRAPLVVEVFQLLGQHPRMPEASKAPSV